MTGTNTSWETRVEIYRLCALGESDSAILRYFGLNQDKYPDAPISRDSIKRIRKEFSSLLPIQLQMAITEEPILEKLLSEKQKQFLDAQILESLGHLFDRPAFTTPFRQESSMPDFKKAITDTIEGLNSGIRRLRDGTEIKRILPRHEIRDRAIRDVFSEIVQKLITLRATYDAYMKDGNIEVVIGNASDSDIFFLSDEAAANMDGQRHRILDEFRRIYPAFKAQLQCEPWDGSLGKERIKHPKPPKHPKDQQDLF